MSFKGLTINNAPETNAHIKADDDRTIWEAIFGVDAVLDIGNKLKATLMDNTKLRILDGVLVTGGAIGRIPFGEYEDVTIPTGIEDQRRNDLVVAEIQANTSVERMKISYVEGTGGTNAVDPSYVKGNVYEGATVRQFPLYRVRLNGINVDGVDKLFEEVGNMKQLSEKASSVDQMKQTVAELNSTLTEKIYADGYVLVECGSLPNNSTTYVNIPLPAGAKDWWISEAWYRNPQKLNFRYTLPHIDIKAWINSVDIAIGDSKQLILTTTANWTGYNAFAVIGYKL